MKMSEIVISGLSGKFPNCDTMEELEEKLYRGIDMVVEDDRRWPTGIYNLPTRNGKLKDLSRFDATFFGVNPKQAEVMDPQLRILIENVYEAIVDAGYNPEELKGKKIGVFVGQTASESMDLLSQKNVETLSGYLISGGNRSMTANRVSFTFDFSGMSLSIDTACSSSLVAFHLAARALEGGEIDGAIVGGVNLLLSPMTSFMYNKLSMLSEDGKCKSFDSSGKGYVRSETVGALFLQKTEHARRAYAQILGTGSNANGYCEMGITYPVGQRQEALIQEVLQRSKVISTDVTYIEAHGPGTKVGDPNEVNALHRVFCQGTKRSAPLLLGSVKSNIGHAEAAASIGQLAKVILSMERRVIPGNLHFDEPNSEIFGLTDGTIKVVDRNLPWDGGIVSINSFGFGGANAHVILKSNPKNKRRVTSHEGIPSLIVCSGRTEEAVKHLLNKVNQHMDDEEFLCLIREIYKINTSGHLFRGFQLRDDCSGPTIVDTPPKKEIWYIFSGMGSQWTGTARALLPLKPFANAITKCAKALKSVGIDLMDMISKDDPLNAANSLLCITAVQIGLVDLLNALGVTPDYIVGHSAGEMGCAYADGGFTAEETVLLAHERGRSLKACADTRGAMAAVSGLTWEEMQSRLHTGVYAACHNSLGNVSISGSETAVRKFVEDLAAEGIASRWIDSSGFAFHCPTIAPAAIAFKEAILKMGLTERKRTAKWISTSVPANCSEKWTSFNSADYHTFNVLNPVRFKEAIDLIPDGSVIVELAPHCLLRGLLKKSVPNSTLIALTNKNYPNGLSSLLKELGKLYNCGVALDLKALYPPIAYPVSQGTPMISNLVKWDHSTKWKVASVPKIETKSGRYQFEVDLKKEEMQFLEGHVINGKTIFPLTGHLVLVWKAFAAKQRMKYDELPVVFSNIQSSGFAFFHAKGSLNLNVNIFEGGKFEVVNNEGLIVMTGHIAKMKGNSNAKCEINGDDSQSTGTLDILSDDVYKLLRLRRYEYSGPFRGIKSADTEGNTGILQWAENWISFIDTMLQFEIFGRHVRKLYVPIAVNRINIDPQKHRQSLPVNSELLVRNCKNTATIKSGGVEIRKVTYSEVTKKELKRGTHVLERQKFVPYTPNEEMTFEDAIRCCVQIIVENSNGTRIKVHEFANDGQELLSLSLCDVLTEDPHALASILISSQSAIDLPERYSKMIKVQRSDYKDVDFKENVIVVTNLTGNISLQKNLLPNMKPNVFILCFEDEPLHLNPPYELIAKFLLENRTLFLYWKTDEKREDPYVMVVDETNFAWVKQLKNWIVENQSSRKPLVLVSSGGGKGLVGFVKCLRLEEPGNSIRVMLLPNEKPTIDDTMMMNQVKKGLVMNVLKGGVWGSYRNLKLRSSQSSDSANPPQIMTLDAYVVLGTKGDLSSLHWINSPLGILHKDNSLGSTLEFCTVDYASLNFRDVMIATGKISNDALPGNSSKQEPALGLEFVGRNSSGKKVMGLLKSKGLATSVIADKRYLWDIPDDWSLEQASTIPMAYSTAYYALIVRGGLRNGETILIHSGCSTVGLAAISIALNRGCEVFTTVGSENKKDFLLCNFNGLKKSNIGNSRNETFEQMVLEETGGRGVDLVLNSLAGDLLNASVRCLAENGRFLEIGKVDLYLDSPLGMSMFLKNTTFHGVLLDSLLESKFDNEIFDLVRLGISSGEVKPLPAIVFQKDQLEQAFRFLGAGKHIGKVVLKIRSEEEWSTSIAPRELIPATNKSYMDSNKVYVIVGSLPWAQFLTIDEGDMENDVDFVDLYGLGIVHTLQEYSNLVYLIHITKLELSIIGGLGGFGLELTDWLIVRGATKVLLVSRFGATTGYQKLCIRRWKRAEIRVIVLEVDCSTKEGARTIIDEGNKLGPIGGIYNLAGILQDGLFLDSQNEETFEKVYSAKISGTFWLDSLSRQMCPHLDAFVTFSSVTSARGNQGQTNYGYANSAMEGLCDKRLADGYPALAIQWGAIGDVGMVERFLQVRDNVKIAGTWPQKIASCLETLDFFLTLSDNKLKSSKHQSSNRSAVVSSMIVADKDVQGVSNDSATKSSVTAFIAGILGIKDTKKLGAVTLTELGMDSLMTSEVIEALENYLDVVMTPEDVRNLTFVQLEEISANRLNR